MLKLVASNGSPKKAHLISETRAAIRRKLIYACNTDGRTIDINKVRFDEIPANWPPFEK
jgi:hypothetical protein